MLNERASLESPVVFDFWDYRVFLREYYTWAKRSSSKFSYRYFSKRCSLKSYNYLKYIIDEKKHLSHKFLDQFAEGLKLGAKERNYFKLLWQYQLETDPERKKEFYIELVRHRRDPVLKELEEAKLAYISDWLYIAMREFFTFTHDMKDISELAETFSVPPKRIRQALTFLKRLRLIKETSTGYVTCEGSVKVPDDLGKSVVRLAHKGLLDLTKEKLDDVGIEGREIGALISVLDPSSLPLLKNRIRDFLVEMNGLMEVGQNRTQVFQLGIQLVPLTRKRNK